MMELSEKIAQTEQNIRQALKDYGEHLYNDSEYREVLYDVSDRFIERLAKDSVVAKQDLRDMLRKSPVWDEKLDALVINGTRTHDPDYDLVWDSAWNILRPAMIGDERTELIEDAIRFFSNPFEPEDIYQRYIKAIKTLAPKAYAPNKKPSRVFKALCDALEVSDDTAGSTFQHNFAQLADELTSKKINFKLFVSINPAHFLTMSNPKGDRRGDTMTSCHSFNKTDYEYNCGCSGYARDKVTMIAFTASNPSDAETLNNRKTTRQLFMYKPGNGLLLQSRLYNTSGGTRGAQAESKLYRDLIQREISACESAPNLWKTRDYYGQDEVYIRGGNGFGGYMDWTFEEFAAKLSIRNDHADDYEEFRVGTYGLCINCAEEISENLYCGSCSDFDECADCDERCSSDDLYEVHDADGDSRWVCSSCRDDYYYCEECEEYHVRDNVTDIGNGYVCNDCLERYYSQCEECEEWFRTGELCDAVDSNGNVIHVCEDCRDANYVECDECGEYVHCDELDENNVCEKCREENEEAEAV